MWTCPPRTPSTRTAYRVRVEGVERSLEVIAAERSVGGIGLAVERDRQEALLLDVDHNERHDHPNPHALAVVAPIRHSCVDHAHSPIVSTVRCVTVCTGAAPQPDASALRSNSGGLPSPTCGVSRERDGRASYPFRTRAIGACARWSCLSGVLRGQHGSGGLDPGPDTEVPGEGAFRQEGASLTISMPPFCCALRAILAKSTTHSEPSRGSLAPR